MFQILFPQQTYIHILYLVQHSAYRSSQALYLPVLHIVNDSVSVLTIYVDEKKKSRECDAEHKFCLEILKISKLEILDVQLAMMKSNIFKEILVLSSCKILCKQGEYLSPFIFRIKESVHSKSNKYQINSTHTAYFRPPCPTFQKINSRKTIICDQPIKL